MSKNIAERIANAVVFRIRGHLRRSLVVSVRALRISKTFNRHREHPVLRRFITDIPGLVEGNARCSNAQGNG